MQDHKELYCLSAVKHWELPIFKCLKSYSKVEISREPVRRILFKNLKLTIFTKCKWHQLSLMITMHFCQLLNQAIRQGILDINNLVFSDESLLYLESSVNEQAFHKWSSEKPTEVIEKPLNFSKIIVWCGLGANMICSKSLFFLRLNMSRCMIFCMNVWFFLLIFVAMFYIN